MADHHRLTPARAQPVVITLPAEIDATNADSTREQLAAAFAPGALVIADMSATTYCDSTGIRALLMAHKQAAAGGTDLRLLIPVPGVLRILQVAGAGTVLPVHQSLDGALVARGVTIRRTRGQPRARR